MKLKIKEKVLKELEDNKFIHQREKVIVRMWIEEALTERNSEVNELIDNKIKECKGYGILKEKVNTLITLEEIKKELGT